MSENEDQWLEQLSGRALARTEAEQRMLAALHSVAKEFDAPAPDSEGLQRVLHRLGREGLLNESKKPVTNLQQRWPRYGMYASLAAAALAVTVSLGLLVVHKGSQPRNWAIDQDIQAPWYGSIEVHAADVGSKREETMSTLRAMGLEPQVVSDGVTGSQIDVQVARGTTLDAFTEWTRELNQTAETPGSYHITIKNPSLSLARRDFQSRNGPVEPGAEASGGYFSIRFWSTDPGAQGSQIISTLSGMGLRPQVVYVGEHGIQISVQVAAGTELKSFRQLAWARNWTVEKPGTYRIIIEKK